MTLILNMETDTKLKYFWSKQNYMEGLKLLKQGGIRMKTKKRNVTMYQFGGTIGWAQTPFYRKHMSQKNHMLPRPVVSCRPGNFGHILLNQSNWIYHLAKLVEKYTLYFFKNDNYFWSKIIMNKTKVCKRIIPECLRICDTFFTSMIVVGNFSGSREIPLHKYSDDCINVIVSIRRSDVI